MCDAPKKPMYYWGHRGGSPETGGSSWILSMGGPQSRQYIQAIPQEICRSTFQKFKRPLWGLRMKSAKEEQLGTVTTSMLSCPRWLTCTTPPLFCLSPHDLEAAMLLNHLSKVTTLSSGIAEEDSGSHLPM